VGKEAEKPECLKVLGKKILESRIDKEAKT
jgi:hypothetical protein